MRLARSPLASRHRRFERRPRLLIDRRVAATLRVFVILEGHPGVTVRQRGNQIRAPVLPIRVFTGPIVQLTVVELGQRHPFGDGASPSTTGPRGVKRLGLDRVRPTLLVSSAGAVASRYVPRVEPKVFGFPLQTFDQSEGGVGTVGGFGGEPSDGVAERDGDAVHARVVSVDVPAAGLGVRRQGLVAVHQ